MYISPRHLASSIPATDGAELAKIQKVKVLRNDKREGWFVDN